jgi:hypothetical protein
MDPALREIAEAAECGEDLPRLCLFAGSLTIWGVPTTSRESGQMMEKSIAEAIYYAGQPSLTRRHLQKAREELAGEAKDRARSYFSQFKGGVEDRSDTIVLKEAQLVLISTGETIKIPTVRVSLVSVDCWFVGHFQSKTPSGGVGFFAIFSPGE